MAILDVRFSRGETWFGRSTSFDPDHERVVALLGQFGRGLRVETGESTEPLVGHVRKPAPSSFRERLQRELDACEATDLVELKVGEQFKPPAARLVLVVDGACELAGAAPPPTLEAASLVLLPGRSGGLTAQAPTLLFVTALE